MRRNAFLLMICLSSFLGARENISLDLQVGFNGVVYSSDPNYLVKATLVNKGESIFRGFIGVEGDTLLKVELAPGGRKSFFYLAGGGCGTSKFSVFSLRRKPLLSRPLPCGVSQEEPLQLIFPPKQIPALHWLVGVGAEDMPPDWRAYMGVELIVVEGNALEKLSKEQRESIRRWLELGGRMIIVGSEDLTRGIGEFSASLLPLQAVRKVNLPHPPSSLLTTPIPLRDIPTTIYPPSPTGRVDLWEGRYPLIVEGQIGWGKVYYWAFQPWRAPFDDWQGLLFLLPPPSSKRPPWWVTWHPFPYGGLEEWNLFPATLKGLKKIPFKVMLLFSLLFTYILIPSIYIGLRIKKKTSSYWLASLICVLILSFAIFLYGLGMKERHTMLKELSLIQFYPHLRLVNHMGVAGIYSPRTATFSLLLERQDTMLRELDTCDEPEGFFYIENGRKRGENLRVSPWGMRTFEYNEWREGDSPLEAELSLEGNKIKGWVRNKSKGTMRNAILIFGQRAYSLGNIGGGEKKEISLDIEKFVSLIGMEKGAIFYPLEELLRRTPEGQLLSSSSKGNLTNCVLLWEGENSPSIGRLQPSPHKIYRQSLYIQHILLPVPKPPEKVPFLCTFSPSLAPAGEEIIIPFSSLPYLWGSPFDFLGLRRFVFAPTIEGIKFSKLVIDIQLDSKSPIEVTLSLRRGKKTYKMERVAQGRSPGHITYTIDKPEEFLMQGRYLHAELERETLSFERMKIKGITVYGVPKGG